MNKLIITTLLLLFSMTGFATEKAHIQVNASGSIDVLPDYIHISVIIEKTHKTREAAKIATDIISQQVIDTAKSLRIEDVHIQASDIFIQPEYQWENNKRIHIGEKIRRTINIKLYFLDNYSNLAERLVKLDITSMQQQGFGFDQIEKHQNKALMQALDKARIKAQQIAHNIKRKLGKVHQVTESSGHTPQPYPAGRMMTMTENTHQGAPLEIKPQTVSASVNVIYRIE